MKTVVILTLNLQPLPPLLRYCIIVLCMEQSPAAEELLRGQVEFHLGTVSVGSSPCPFS